MRAGFMTHGFLNLDTTAMFDAHIINIGVGYLLGISPDKALAKAENYKKEKYL